MSTQSTFSRNSLSDLFSSLNNNPSSSSNNNLSPDMALNYSSSKNNYSSSDATSHHRHHHQRPVSEILKHESYISPESEELDKWFEDLQQYESKLESMANASLDPKYKEEVQHVDQWFRYLNEAERTATIYTLLLHSTPVQIRFFIALLQQQMPAGTKRDSFSPYYHHSEKDMQNHQLAGAMAKAELEASQKLLSVLPYQTGQVIKRPNANIGRRNHIDRHSFALGDTEEYNRLFASNNNNNNNNNNNRITASNEFLSPRNSLHSVLDENQRRSMLFDGSGRPKSVIENGAGELSNIFNQDWSYGGLVGHQRSRPNSVISAASRPKSADITNWSFGMTTSNKRTDWSSPTTFNDQQQDVDQLSTMMANNWHGGGSNRSSTIDEQQAKFNSSRRNTRGSSLSQHNRSSMFLHDTVPETDERLAMQSPPPPAPATLVSPPVVLSMYDQSGPSTLFNASTYSPIPTKLQQQQKSYNNAQQFLNPPPSAGVEENGYHSDDHSETSHQSGLATSAAKSFKHKLLVGGTIFPSVNRLSTNNNKKHVDVVDMQLLEDVPAWLRSLRLHKYNPIFELTKWQEMLKMDDDALLAKGVAALGARRKLLKVFDQVKAHCQNIPY